MRPFVLIMIILLKVVTQDFLLFYLIFESVHYDEIIWLRIFLRNAFFSFGLASEVPKLTHYGMV